MFSKDMKLGYLLTFYRELLDERTQEIMSSYYEDDLSLAEIADGVGISRQGVRHIIKRAEEDLLFYEDRLHFARKFEAQGRIADEIKSLADKCREDKALAPLTERLDAILQGLIDIYKN
ncbi:MAG: winged helix-turn-helix transcriptional regulator [Clostridia bacterium]|nr:winged helix-turn-helix transcriptional regulator [Clostridia bacterium]MBQ2737847.1 winged helix-turn-helix transcriptional regulator [Clostridia bacterium]MBQ8289557.1 winged helix-turn-helix transcriptional regulator [Clostridia bacterium]